MTDIIIILPYFGKFHGYFQLFLKTCGANDKFTWLILTDDKTEYEYPENVIVEYMEFSDLKKLIQEKFPFPICLDRPYKLCDFRPAYGYIFKERIKQYHYWGHCDCDLLFGDLNSMVLPLFGRGYDKIFAAGHLTFYKNTEENNRRFMLPLDNHHYFRQYSQENAGRGFDEDGGNINNIHRIYKAYGAMIYEDDMSYNCNALYHNFRRNKYNGSTGKWQVEPWEKSAFYWEKGKLFQLIYSNRGEVTKREYIYIHFQGRKEMTVKGEGSFSGTIRICPDTLSFVDKLPGNIGEIKQAVKKEWSTEVLRLFIFRQRLKLGKLKIKALNVMKKR